jgi:class 3 adenylate cyclase
MTKTINMPKGNLSPCALLALDAAGHSRQVRQLSAKKVHEVFRNLEKLVRTEVEKEGGFLLGWQGDGGIAVFYVEEHTDDEIRATKALRAAENVLKMLPILNKQYDLEGENQLRLRIALHAGNLIYFSDSGSIHSDDVNFVAHLQHALPEDLIGISDQFWKALGSEHKNICLEVDFFEGHKIFLYGRDPLVTELARKRYKEKRIREMMGQLCSQVGLVHLEFRDPAQKLLPPVDIYSNAITEILMVGVSLARSLNPRKPNPTLQALRVASTQRKVKLYFLMLDPKQPAGLPYASGVDNIPDAVSWIKDEISNGNFREKDVQCRGLAEWPHYSGVMIDGNVEGIVNGDLMQTISSSDSFMLRIQPTIPPEGHHSQHYAPIYQYAQGQSMDTICAYVRGFRHYWSKGKSLL